AGLLKEGLNQGSAPSWGVSRVWEALVRPKWWVVLLLAVVIPPLSIISDASAGTLDPPSSLTTTAISTSQINLSWVDTNTSENGVEIERSLNPTSGFAVVGTVSKGVTSFSDLLLTSSTTYYYRVRATSSSGNYSGYSNVASATTLTPPDVTAPSVPIG